MFATLPKISDPDTHERFGVGVLLGTGTFANCYELFDSNNKLFALKRVAKQKLLKNPLLLRQLKDEIAIHRTLDHENIVKFHSNFEDKYFFYMILEICMQKSLRELKQCRFKITEPETRYFCRQLILACDYLHMRRIIHRDLKLENVFLNSEMVVKLGDFGLAAQLTSDHDRRRTFCGTPNYVAPHVLAKKSYSFEADTWSLGVIVFVLLTGSYPFVADSLSEMYSQIKKAQYVIPDEVGHSAQEVIRSLLQITNIPTMKSLLEMPFFKEYTPNVLPTSVLSSAPRFDSILTPEPVKMETRTFYSEAGMASEYCFSGYKNDTDKRNGLTNDLLVQLRKLLTNVAVLEDLPSQISRQKWHETVQDRALTPVFWITKWLDYSLKMGFGYQLNDSSAGVEFLDKSRLIVTTNDDNIQYIDPDGCEALYTRLNFPNQLLQKLEFHSYFKRYMSEKLQTVGKDVSNSEKDSMVRLPFLLSWQRNEKAIILLLNSGTTQINFFSDHVKVIFCPHMRSVTIVDEKKDFKTYAFSKLYQSGMTRSLKSRIEKCMEVMENWVKN